MPDRIEIQIRFKKCLWTCPSCKQEDVEDRNASGGDSYEHTCSKCATKFNQSGSNAKFYDGCMNIDKTEYESMKAEDVDKKKKDRFDEWVTEIKNPPAYVEPSKEDYLNLHNEKMADAKMYLEKYAEKATESELAALKTESEAKISEVMKK